MMSWPKIDDERAAPPVAFRSLAPEVATEGLRRDDMPPNPINRASFGWGLSRSCSSSEPLLGDLNSTESPGLSRTSRWRIEHAVAPEFERRLWGRTNLAFGVLEARDGPGIWSIAQPLGRLSTCSFRVSLSGPAEFTLFSGSPRHFHADDPCGRS